MIVPPSTPRIRADQVLEWVKNKNVCQLIGIRGYYKNTMGVPDTNDVGIYDDAIVLYSPNVFATFNANTDPSVLRKNVAVLMPGFYWYKLGIHGLSKPPERRYEALVQMDVVTIKRHNGNEETGFFGINIHKGGYNTTSSEGCQTIYPAQWPHFIALVKGELTRMNQKIISYYLV